MGLVLEFDVSWTVMHLFLVFLEQLFVSFKGTLLYDLPEAWLGDFVLAFFEEIEDRRGFGRLDKPLRDGVNGIYMALVIIDE